MRMFSALIIALIGVLVFVGVGSAQNADPTLEEDLVAACEDAGGRMQDGTCFVDPGNWCGFDDSPALCDDRRFDGRWMADPELLPDTLGGSVEPEPVTAAEFPAQAVPATPTPAAPTYTG